jgi:hypothetical protein
MEKGTRRARTVREEHESVPCMIPGAHAHQVARVRRDPYRRVSAVIGLKLRGVFPDAYAWDYW